MTNNISEAIATIKKGVDAVDVFSSNINKYVPISELKHLAVIAPNIETLVEEFDHFFENAPKMLETGVATSEPQPVSIPPVEIESQILFRENLRITEEGRFYDVDTDAEIIPFWHDGEMRLNLNGEIKRCSTLVATAFGIKSDNRDADYILEYRNGDRRDLSPGNLYWVLPSKKPNFRVLLIEDICRRIIDFDGDIKKVVAMYDGSNAKISEQLVKLILTKQEQKSISDAFFELDSDGHPISLLKNYQGTGLDCYGLLAQTKDPVLVTEMLKRKVDANQSISDAEIIMMMKAVEDGKVHKFQWYSDTIYSKFGFEIKPIQLQNTVTNSTITETISNMWGVENG
jgi:hypothetical protein